MVKLKGIVWIAFVVMVAAALPFRFDVDFTALNVRLTVTSVIILLVTYSAWVKSRVDRLQESESRDEDDEEYLYAATSHLQHQLWVLAGLYFVTFLALLIAMIIGGNGAMGLAVAWLTYVLFFMSVLFVPALHNIDLAASKEVHRRKQEIHKSRLRHSQHERIDSEDPMPEKTEKRLKRYNEEL